MHEAPKEVANCMQCVPFAFLPGILRNKFLFYLGIQKVDIRMGVLFNGTSAIWTLIDPRLFKLCALVLYWISLSLARQNVVHSKFAIIIFLLF